MFFFQSSPKSQPNILNNLCGKFVATVFQKSPNLVTLGSVSVLSGFLKDLWLQISHKGCSKYLATFYGLLWKTSLFTKKLFGQPLVKIGLLFFVIWSRKPQIKCLKRNIGADLPSFSFDPQIQCKYDFAAMNFLVLKSMILGMQHWMQFWPLGVSNKNVKIKLLKWHQLVKRRLEGFSWVVIVLSGIIWTWPSSICRWNSNPRSFERESSPIGNH